MPNRQKNLTTTKLYYTVAPTIFEPKNNHMKSRRK